MPTPTFVYAEAASKWGGVCVDDEKAVEDFFVNKFKDLSAKTQSEIIAYLLKGETRRKS